MKNNNRPLSLIKSNPDLCHFRLFSVAMKNENSKSLCGSIVTLSHVVPAARLFLSDYRCGSLAVLFIRSMCI